MSLVNPKLNVEKLRLSEVRFLAARRQGRQDNSFAPISCKNLISTFNEVKKGFDYLCQNKKQVLHNLQLYCQITVSLVSNTIEM